MEKTRHIPGDFYLNSVGIKDVEDFMNKIIVTFMDEYRPSENGDEKDVQMFLEMLEPFIVTTFLRYFNY